MIPLWHSPLSSFSFSPYCTLPGDASWRHQEWLASVISPWLSTDISLGQRANDFTDGQAGLGLSVWCKQNSESTVHSFVWFSFWVWPSHPGSHSLHVPPKSSFTANALLPCFLCRRAWVLESQKFGSLVRWHRLSNQAFQVQSPNLPTMSWGTWVNALVSVSL